MKFTHFEWWHRPAPHPPPRTITLGPPVITAPDVMCGTPPPAAGRPAGEFLQRSA
ncbi:hypothetical protein ACIO8H_25630 [Streptomyces sp. NPDC087226]|uniref:hypothetical protein n=1 Tax=Streptomyces sp. NPDC087226 TaxID=3365771 RepID=UPI0038072452